MITLHEFTNSGDWLQTLVENTRTIAEQAVADRGHCAIALSGGSTPRPLYENLSLCPLPWNKMSWWIGDERWVSPQDDQSNEKMIRHSFKAAKMHFASHFHSWHPAETAGLAAGIYQKKLIAQLGTPPVLDLVYLGLGEDGHTASLFPHTEALDEKELFAVENFVPQLNTTRVTLTYPALNAAREIWFIVSGAGKAAMIERLLKRDMTIPSAGITAPNQQLFWVK